MIKKFKLAAISWQLAVVIRAASYELQAAS